MITVMKEKEEDWWCGFCKEKVGMFPVNYVMEMGEAESYEVRAAYNFKPQYVEDLPFNKGDIILVMDDRYKDWWCGRSENRVGVFPRRYVRKI